MEVDVALVPTLGHVDVALVPTLGHVAKETRFDPLRNLLEQVKDTPVNELSTGLRSKLQRKAGEELELLMESFFAACDATVRRMETAQKRPRYSNNSEEGTDVGECLQETFDLSFFETYLFRHGSFWAHWSPFS